MENPMKMDDLLVPSFRLPRARTEKTCRATTAQSVTSSEQRSNLDTVDTIDTARACVLSVKKKACKFTSPETIGNSSVSQLRQSFDGHSALNLEIPLDGRICMSLGQKNEQK